MSEALLKKFFKGECSEEESKLVRAYLENNPEAGQSYATQESWEQFQPSQPLPVAVADKMLAQIEASVSNNRQTKNSYRWMAAAAALLAIVAGIYIVLQQQQTDKNAMVQATSRVQPDQSVWKRIYNNTSRTMVVHLQDGSEVALEPGSELQCRQQQVADRRSIRLKGQALFTVVPDKKRPFTVQAGGLTTKVLGTVFRITAWGDGRKDIRIHLLSGKVSVKADSLPAIGNAGSTYLEPGQEVYYNPSRRLMVVHRIANVATETPVAKTPALPVTELLTFNDEPLVKILQKITDKCNVRFHYGTGILADMNYTGNLTIGKDSLDIFLSDIATLNNLTIQKKNGVIHITR